MDTSLVLSLNFEIKPPSTPLELLKLQTKAPEKPYTVREVVPQTEPDGKHKKRPAFEYTSPEEEKQFEERRIREMQEMSERAKAQQLEIIR